MTGDLIVTNESFEPLPSRAGGLTFSVPVAQLAGFLVLAVAVGVLAAVAPARRGARVDVLDALHQD